MLRERILFIQCACFYLQFWKSLPAGFSFFFSLPYSCHARSCIFLAKCSLLARGEQEILCQRIKQAEVCQNKYSSLKIRSCGGRGRGGQWRRPGHVLRLCIYFIRILCSERLLLVGMLEEARLWNIKYTDEEGWVFRGFLVCFCVQYSAHMMTSFVKSETFL